MAKPGSAAAALLSSGLAHDLSQPRTASLDEQRIELERKLGWRCGGCKRRIVSGFKFTTFIVVESKGAADRLAKAVTYACSRPGCEYAGKCAMDAAAMEMTPEMVYLDEQRGERITGAADPAMEFVGQDSSSAGTLPTL